MLFKYRGMLMIEQGSDFNIYGGRGYQRLCPMKMRLGPQYFLQHEKAGTLF